MRPTPEDVHRADERDDQKVEHRGDEELQDLLVDRVVRGEGVAPVVRRFIGGRGRAGGLSGGPRSTRTRPRRRRRRRRRRRLRRARVPLRGPPPPPSPPRAPPRTRPSERGAIGGRGRTASRARGAARRRGERRARDAAAGAAAGAARDGARGEPTRGRPPATMRTRRSPGRRADATSAERRSARRRARTRARRSRRPSRRPRCARACDGGGAEAARGRVRGGRGRALTVPAEAIKPSASTWPACGARRRQVATGAMDARTESVGASRTSEVGKKKESARSLREGRLSSRYSLSSRAAASNRPRRLVASGARVRACSCAPRGSLPRRPLAVTRRLF